MHSIKRLVIHYPPRPPYGDWLPINAVLSYLDTYRDAQLDAKKLLERIAISEIAAPTIIKLNSRMDYLGWGLLFDTAIDAAFLDYNQRHAALPEADRLRDSIAEKANELADLLDAYQETTRKGKISTGFDASGLCIGTLIGMTYEFREQLRDMATHLPRVAHTRVGIGKAAWTSRVQSTADGLPQFVRYFDDRVKTLYESGSSTGGLTVLTPTQLARLAIPALNIKSDKDILGETIERIKGIRKQG